MHTRIKSYIIAVQQIKQSIDSAKRAQISAQKHGLTPHIFQGVYKDDSRSIAEKYHFPINLKDTSNRSNHDAAIACFLSHYALWEKSASSDSPIIIMEHDCILTAPIPKIPSKWDIVNLGKPSYNKIKKPKKLYLLWSKIKNKPIITKHFSMSHLPGTHAYYITPSGAQSLIKATQNFGIIEVDHFIKRSRFPKLGECYPWPAKAEPTFSSIQNI